MQPIYHVLLQQTVDEAMPQKDVLGILLVGSVARGDALPGADLDLRFILAPGVSRKAEPEVRQGILIERGYADMAQAQSKLATNPMKIYNYLDGRILGRTPLSGERAQASLRGRPRGRLGRVGSGNGCMRGRPRDRLGSTQGAGVVL
jgi:hypothetical protein